MFKIYVCENFYPEIEYVVNNSGYTDVDVISYPDMCTNRKNIPKVRELIDQNKEEAYIVCGRHCKIREIAGGKDFYSEILSDFFCSNLANKGFLRYIAKKGGYVIGSGWLNNWEKRIEEMGFDKKNARKFFKETSSELVFFDAKIDRKAEDKLIRLSNFLDMPYTMIETDLGMVETVLDKILEKNEKKNLKENNKKILRESQFRQAEYASIINILGKLTSTSRMDEIKDKIKEIFIGIMGAKNYKLYSGNEIAKNEDGIIVRDMLEGKYDKKLFRDKEAFYIALKSKEKVHGAIKACEFMFPEYIDKYYNFAVSIAPICALAINNIENYQEIIDKKEKLEYISYHDVLTGLYNRGYLEEMIVKEKEYKNAGVFSIDIDGLKDVNDKYGHYKGDELIISVSDILKDSCTGSDIVARVGGDEFVIISLDTSKKELKKLKSRIEINVEKRNAKATNKEYDISVSSAYAFGNINSYQDYESLSKEADDLMYKEKREKKRRMA